MLTHWNVGFLVLGVFYFFLVRLLLVLVFHLALQGLDLVLQHDILLRGEFLRFLFGEQFLLGGFLNFDFFFGLLRFAFIVFAMVFKGLLLDYFEVVFVEVFIQQESGLNFVLFFVSQIFLFDEFHGIKNQIDILEFMLDPIVGEVPEIVLRFPYTEFCELPAVEAPHFALFVQWAAGEHLGFFDFVEFEDRLLMCL